MTLARGVQDSGSRNRSTVPQGLFVNWTLSRIDFIRILVFEHTDCIIAVFGYKSILDGVRRHYLKLTSIRISESSDFPRLINSL